jgi:hypothetical protein
MLDKNKNSRIFRTAILLLTRHKAREMHLITQFKAKMPLSALYARNPEWSVKYVLFVEAE